MYKSEKTVQWTIFSDLYDNYHQLNNGKSYEDLAKEIEQYKSLNADYGEYIKWLGKQDKEKARKYWENELEGYDNDSDIKPAIKPPVSDREAIDYNVELSSEVTDKLRKLAERLETTINIVAETAVGILVQVYSRSSDVVLGKVVSGRNADIPGIEDMIGLFINTIPVRVRIAEKTTAKKH